MKNVKTFNRRQFINLGSRLFLSLPMVYAIGCVSEKEYPLNPQESLKKLILLVGPWPNTEKQKAEDFTKRFLKAKHAVSPYLPGSSKLVQSLASHFTTETMAVSEINLQNLPAKERKLLVILTQQVYSFVEVRFDVANEPPWGQCLGDPMWHTRTPVQSKT